MDEENDYGFREPKPQNPTYLKFILFIHFPTNSFYDSDHEYMHQYVQLMFAI